MSNSPHSPGPPSRFLRGLRARPRSLGAGVGLTLFAALAVAGCGIGLSSTSESFVGPGTTAGADGGVGGSSAGSGSGTTPKTTVSTPGVDAGAALGAGDAYPGASPLCGMSFTTCDPDDGPCPPPATASADASATPADDAGLGTVPADAAVAPAKYGCHVTATRSEAGLASAAPVCSPAGTGRSESFCRSSSDCAPNFDCVLDSGHAAADGAAAEGVCRRYCCDNVCADGASFCDIELTVSGSVAVPVCVGRSASPTASDAGASCQLLDDTSCSVPGTSCQVVNANTGEVACVSPGSATVGQSCETTNCAAGLSCIAGYFPQRKCAQLCSSDSLSCPTGQTCAQSLSLSGVNASIGVCSL